MKFESIAYMEWAKTQPGAAVDLRRSGLDRYPLKELKFPFDDKELTGHNVYGYPPFLEKMAERYGTEPDQVISCLGTSQALFMVCAALLQPGDEVVVEKPAYEPLLAVPRSFGAELKRLDRPFESGYAWDPDALKHSFGPRTRLVILTNLHNPSGVFQPLELIRQVAEWASQKGAWVLVDEVYLDFLQGERAESSFQIMDNIFVISSLTKVYGLGGIRAGWVISPPEWVQKMRHIIDHVHVEHVYISEHIALHALDRLDEIQAYHQPRIEENTALMKDFMRSEKGLAWIEPDGGIVCFPRLEIETDGDRFCTYLRDRYDTALVPGCFFEAPRSFRLAFGAKSDILKRGLDHISSALRELG